MDTNNKCPYCGRDMFVEHINTSAGAVEQTMDGGISVVHIKRTTTLRCSGSNCDTKVIHCDSIVCTPRPN